MCVCAVHTLWPCMRDILNSTLTLSKFFPRYHRLFVFFPTEKSLDTQLFDGCVHFPK